MNSIVLMGEILSDPEARVTADSLDVTSMMVQFPGTRPEDDPYQVKVTAFGELAKTVAGTCRAGEQITVEGQIHIYSVDRSDGRKDKVAEINARRVYPLGAGLPQSLPTGSPSSPSSSPGPAPTPQKAAAPRPAPAPAPSRAPTPAEPNLDDIPF